MNPFDIAIIFIIGFSLIRGFFRGLIKELSSIIGVFAGFYAAYMYYPQVAKLFTRWISNPAYLNIISFFILFCGVFFIISILGIIIKYILNVAFLGWVDRICGAGFGTIKGILIVSVLLAVLTAFLPKGSPIIKKSLLAPHVMVISEKMVQVASKELKHEFKAKIKELQRAWKTP
jgi:membrane protein required for colicin V production